MIKRNPAIRPTKKLGASCIRKRPYSEILKDLQNESEDIRNTMLYKRLLIRAEMLRKEEGNRDENN